MQPRCSRDAAEMQPRCSRDLATSAVQASGIAPQASPLPPPPPGDECALGVALQIIDCHHCQIYCCAPVRTAGLPAEITPRSPARQVELLGNSHSSILLGGVSRVVSARLCERVTLVAAAAAVRAHGRARSAPPGTA